MSDTATVISDAINKVNSSNDVINNTIKTESQKAGYTVSNEMNKIWTDENGVIKSGFEGVKKNVETETGVLTSFKEDYERLMTAQKTAIEIEFEELKSKQETSNKNTSSVVERISTISDTLTEISGKLDGLKSSNNSIKGTNGSSSNLQNIQTGSSSGSTINGVEFKYKKSSYNKNDLNIDYSVVDRLKYNDFDSSVSARASYFKQMGLEEKYGTYKNTSDQNIAMLKWLKKNVKLNSYASGGFNLKKQLAWTQENGKQEYIIRSSDGAILTPIGNGDSVLNSEASKNLYNMANAHGKFIVDNLAKASMPDFSKVKVNGGNSNQFGDISITIPLNNVTNVNEFLREFQSNPKVEAVIKDVVANSLGTSSSFAKYRYKL